ncbi:MAG: hypothetical protein L7F78_04190 [Syntrophales bacterium LBB04]|nr:hypothetical protein [Syntrophales bacterium LBB04]
MKTRLWITALFILMILALAQTQSLASGTAYYLSGYKLVELMRADEKVDTGSATGADTYESGRYCGYILGVCDAMARAYDAPNNANVGQIVAVVTKYVRDHPEKWNEPAADLVIKALQEAFPLKRPAK